MITQVFLLMPWSSPTLPANAGWIESHGEEKNQTTKLA